MRITEVRTIPLKSLGTPAPKGVGNVLVTPSSMFYEPQRNRQPGGPPIAYLLVEVATDAGLTGVGTVGAANGHALYTIENHLNMGKATGQPVYNLLGGRTRERIRAYASRLYATEDLDALAAEAQAFVDQGFTAMKQRFGYGPRDGVAGMRRNMELIKTVREVIGPDVELAADAYMGWDVNYAIRMIHMLEDAGMQLAWVEEPVMPDDVEGYAQIAAACDTLISGGEHEFTRYGFRELIDRRAVDIVQIDVNRAGGITDADWLCRRQRDVLDGVCRRAAAAGWVYHAARSARTRP